MHCLRNLSIKSKLLAINMFTSVAALLLASAGFIYQEMRSFQESAVLEAETIAQIMAEAGTAAATFADSKAARETLSMLRTETRVRAACLYAGNGRLLASFVLRQGLGCPVPDPPPPFTELKQDLLSLARPILLDGQQAGTVLLRFDLSELGARRRRHALISLGVLGFCLLFALVVSELLQRIISGPILDLAETASLVSAQSNYKLRAQAACRDEIGTLVERFNEMLEQIHARDEALNRAQEQLEARVADRTRELLTEIEQHKQTQQDLLAAKEAAEKANAAKSAFLANMSHELRTPLNAIIGYAELLTEEAADAGVPEFTPDLTKIGASGKHLLALINDVLDISKIEAGRMEVKREPVSVGSLLDEVLNTSEPLARKNGNRLEAECHDREAVLFVDATKFRQSLLNLLSNACKFTENGQVTLVVTESVEDGRRWMRWQVRDTGIGIAPENLDRLFRAFSQLDSSSTRRHGGTGLGLAISQRLCQLMGGGIEVSSEPGKGSTFTIRIPAEGEPDAAALPANAAGTVVVIEEDSAAAGELARILRRAGYRVEQGSFGQVAAGKGRDWPLAVVLGPATRGGNGWTALQRVISAPPLAGAPVLVTSPAAPDSPLGPLASCVLVVEDDPACRELLVRNLRSRFSRVIEAENGRAGLDRLRENTPALVVVDLMMPGMDGFEFLERMRAEPAWRRIPAVVWTARDITRDDLDRLQGAVSAVVGKARVAPAALADLACGLSRGVQTAQEVL